VPQRFPYDVDLRFAPVLLPLGLRPRRDGVVLTDDGRFRATYGWVTIETPIANIKTAENTGPYAPWKSVGIRLSLADSGLTFGTTGRSGVCVTFHDRVRGVVGRRHAGLTVTVADPDGLLAAIQRVQQDTR
jgi:hypothetical protein